MKILPYFSRSYPSNSYVIYSNLEAAILDPSISYNEFLRQYPEIADLKFKYIILTHAHFDHILQLDDWVEKTSATLLVGRDDAEMLTDSSKNQYMQFMRIDKTYNIDHMSLNNGDIIELGNSYIKATHAPGHTKGSIFLETPNAVFVGDTVFAGGGVGRTDFYGGNIQKLFSSVNYLKNLPKGTLIYPGHGMSFLSDEINFQI